MRHPITIIDPSASHTLNKIQMEYSKAYQLMEREFCNCPKRGSLPSINHDDDCRFALITKDSQIIYNDFKVIQDYVKKTHQELGVLKTEVSEMKAEMAEMKTGLTEIRSMMGDLLTLFRASKEN